jgi:hypothetical protein
VSKAWSERHGRGPDGPVPRDVSSVRGAGHVATGFQSRGDGHGPVEVVARLLKVALMCLSSDFCRVVEANQAFTPIKRDASAMLTRAHSTDSLTQTRLLPPFWS